MKHGEIPISIATGECVVPGIRVNILVTKYMSGGTSVDCGLYDQNTTRCGAGRMCVWNRSLEPEVREDPILRVVTAAGETEFDTNRWHIKGPFDDSAVVPVSRGEGGIFIDLAQNQGAVLPRTRLLVASGSRPETGPRTIDTLVRSLRKKIGQERGRPPIIETVINGGYWIPPAPEKPLQ